MSKETDKLAPSLLFEGMVSVRAVLDAMKDGRSDRKIIKLYYDSERAGSKPNELAYLRHRADEYGFEIVMCGRGEIDSMTLGNTHGGVAAECTPRTFREISSENIADGGFYVLLDGVEDPYNFGYALRSLYAAGVAGILLSPRNWMSAAGIVCRSSAGASEAFDMFACSDTADAVKLFKSRGFSIVCSGIENSVSIYQTRLRFPLLLIVGGEKRGIASKLTGLCDATVRIDYARQFPEALSAASAASILAFEIMRQNQ